MSDVQIQIGAKENPLSDVQMTIQGKASSATVMRFMYSEKNYT